MRYTFGTSEKAAGRLYEISRFFNPLAAEFIKKHYRGQVSRAIDLGCGPGFTTHMLAQATQAKEVYGLDVSDNFLSIAGESFPGYRFIKHDVTRTPFPVTGEVCYARFVLSHLPDAVGLAEQWCNALAEGGMLFVEEGEGIETDMDVFKTYLEINQGLIATQGGDLHVGKRLAAGKYDCKVVSNECAVLPVENWQAATWFHPNTITIWEEEKCVKERLSGEERREISRRLGEIKEQKEKKSNITWKMRRIVLMKNS